MEAAEMQSDANTIFDIIEDLKANMAHHEPLLDFAEQLRKLNLKILLKNDRYRKHLISDPVRMLAQLDELEVQTKLSPVVYSARYGCESTIFLPQGTSRPRPCIACRSGRVAPHRVAYLPKQ